MATPSKPRRRWFTFSLRGLFVAITIFSVWLGVAVNRARQQREAVQQLEAICGKAVYDWEPDRRILGLPAPPPRTHPPAPSWLRRLLGDEFFQEVRDVELWVCSPADKLFFRGTKRWALTEEELGAAIPVLQRFPKAENRLVADDVYQLNALAPKSNQ